jgi:hypothetical protein
MTVAELRDLLGHDVLLLAWPNGSKGEKRKWKHLTVANMTPEYLAKLPQGNIGVVLGEKSGGLIAIDFDDESLVEPFLALNPHLRNTLQTHGARGLVFWLQMVGDYPDATKKLKTHSGEACGEFRSNGSQSIIHGIHPNGRAYQVVNMAKPLAVAFASIVWPPQISNPPRLNSASFVSASCVSASLHPCAPTSLHDCIPASLHNNAGKVLANIAARTDAQKALTAKNPRLMKLYSGFVEPRFQAQAHARNHFIVTAVPFLFCAVASLSVLELVGCFYDCNHGLFNDPREQHMKEAKAMLESVAKTYVASLTSGERKIYDALPEPEQDAFRICRDLALLKKPERESLTFFLSFDHLGDRLGIHPPQAQRIMRQLESYGLIKLLKKGTRRAAGVRGEAGIYRWLIS